jgi:hypothetical protein
LIFGFTFYFLESLRVSFEDFPSCLPTYNLNELLLFILLLLSLLKTEDELSLSFLEAEGEIAGLVVLATLETMLFCDVFLWIFEGTLLVIF